jgi:hypothetical protein
MLTAVEVLGPGDWREEPLPHRILSPSTESLIVITDGERRYVRKMLRRPPDGSCKSPRAHDFWAREALALESGLLDGCPMPRAVWVERLGEDGFALWTEWAGAPLNDPARAAAIAAEVNARRLPRAPEWAAIGWMRSWVESQGDLGPLLEEDARWDHPLIAPYWGEYRSSMRAWWRQRDSLLDAYERLPRCHVHGDLFGANLFEREGRALLIDWGATREGVPGEDVAHLVCSEQAEFRAEDVAALAGTCLRAYGADDAALEGFRLSCILRRGFALARVVTWTRIPDAEEEAPRRFGRSLQELLANRGQLARWISTV